MSTQVLKFFLLVLKILLNLSPDISHKQGKFSKTLLEKDLKFIPNRGDGTLTFDLSLMLLLSEVNLIAKKQDCKRDALVASGNGYI